MPEEDVFNDDIEVTADIPENPIVNEYLSKISIGDVETLDYGESAYVTNTGTEENPVLNFGLPKGASGTLWGQLDGMLSDQTDLKEALDAKDTAIATKANIASPAFTGTPTAPTAVSGTSNTQVATTAFVQNAISILNTNLTNYINNYINSVVGSMLKAPNFAAAVILSAEQQYNGYTPGVDGYLLLKCKSGSSSPEIVATCTVAGKTIFNRTRSSGYEEDNFWVPLPAGQQIKTNAAKNFNNTYVSQFERVMFVPFK